MHLARGPEILREEAWTRSHCDVRPMDNKPLQQSGSPQ